VFQPDDGAERRLVVDPHVDRRGPAVSDRAVHPQHPLQTIAGYRHGVGAGTVLSEMMGLPRYLLLAACYLRLAARYLLLAARCLLLVLAMAPRVHAATCESLMS